MLQLLFSLQFQIIFDDIKNAWKTSCLYKDCKRHAAYKHLYLFNSHTVFIDKSEEDISEMLSQRITHCLFVSFLFYSSKWRVWSFPGWPRGSGHWPHLQVAGMVSTAWGNLAGQQRTDTEGEGGHTKPADFFGPFWCCQFHDPRTWIRHGSLLQNSQRSPQHSMWIPSPDFR